jgi:hypothetical protein
MKREIYEELNNLNRRIEYLVNQHWTECPKNLRYDYKVPMFKPENYTDIADAKYVVKENN